MLTVIHRIDSLITLAFFYNKHFLMKTKTRQNKSMSMLIFYLLQKKEGKNKERKKNEIKK